jgi:hypothetical protein
VRHDSASRSPPPIPVPSRHPLGTRACALAVSVHLADLQYQAQRPPDVGGRYTTRTRVHHAINPLLRGSDNIELPSWSADESIAYINESCAQEAVSSCGLHFAASPSWHCDWTYGRRFKGLVMGTKTTNVISSVILAGPRAEEVVATFRALNGDPSTHKALGLHGDAHVALQDVKQSTGELVVVRMSTEHREDMHRMLHHCLRPLEEQLGVAPYARMLNSARTVQMGHVLFNATPFISDPAEGGFDETRGSQGLHVQHST